MTEAVKEILESPPLRPKWTELKKKVEEAVKKEAKRPGGDPKLVEKFTAHDKKYDQDLGRLLERWAAYHTDARKFLEARAKLESTLATYLKSLVVARFPKVVADPFMAGMQALLKDVKDRGSKAVEVYRELSARGIQTEGTFKEPEADGKKSANPDGDFKTVSPITILQTDVVEYFRRPKRIPLAKLEAALMLTSPAVLTRFPAAMDPNLVTDLLQKALSPSRFVEAVEDAVDRALGLAGVTATTLPQILAKLLLRVPDAVVGDLNKQLTALGFTTHGPEGYQIEVAGLKLRN